MNGEGPLNTEDLFVSAVHPPLVFFPPQSFRISTFLTATHSLAAQDIDFSSRLPWLDIHAHACCVFLLSQLCPCR